MLQIALRLPMPLVRVGDAGGADLDTLNGVNFLHEIYTRADPAISGRATVPVLWDKQRGTIVNNESADILQMLNSGFGDFADTTFDLYPADLREEIDAIIPTTGSETVPSLGVRLEAISALPVASYRATGKPLHEVGPSDANVPMMAWPPGTRARSMTRR